MQDKHDPNWSEDAAFWEEAWADMQVRLDARNDDRKVVAIWWKRPVWLLLGGIMLLIVAITPSLINHYFPTEGEAQPIPAIETNIPVEKIADKAATPNDLPATAPPVTEKAVEQVTPPGAKNTASLTVASRKLKSDEQTPSLLPTITNPVITTDPETVELLEHTATGNEVRITTTSDTEPSEQPVDQAGQPKRLLSPVAQLPISPIDLAHEPLAEFPAATITRTRRPVEAGIQAGISTPVNGEYAGIYASVPLGRRFALPVSLRYRRDHLFLTDYPSGSSDDLAFGSPVTGGAVSGDSLYVRFSSDNLSQLNTTGLEGSIGLSFIISPRWEMSSSFAATRLFSAKAVLSQSLRRELENAYIPLGNQSAVDSFLDLSPDTRTSNLVSADGISSPSLTQWLIRTKLNLTYRLSSRFQLTTGGSWLLAQPDKAKVIGLQPFQLEMGVQLKLR